MINAPHLMKSAMAAVRPSVPLLVLILVIADSAAAAAQIPPDVRVINAAPIARWLHGESDILATVEPGTTLGVLGKEGGWYWVIAPPDAHGTRPAGWIAAGSVEVVAETATRLAPAPILQIERPVSVPPKGISAQAPAGAPVAVTRRVAAADSANARAARKDYDFEDVHFALNRYSLRSKETTILDGAANKLKDDPLLRLNVEGYTCNLGTPAYNLSLGDRRANAVKDYLMSKGVPGDQLRTMSFGEERAKHDNSHKETRPLNRRVALVPNVQP